MSPAHSISLTPLSPSFVESYTEQAKRQIYKVQPPYRHQKLRPLAVNHTLRISRHFKGSHWLLEKLSSALPRRPRQISRTSSSEYKRSASRLELKYPSIFLPTSTSSFLLQRLSIPTTRHWVSTTTSCLPYHIYSSLQSLRATSFMVRNIIFFVPFEHFIPEIPIQSPLLDCRSVPRVLRLEGSSSLLSMLLSSLRTF